MSSTLDRLRAAATTAAPEAPAAAAQPAPATPAQTVHTPEVIAPAAAASSVPSAAAPAPAAEGGLLPTSVGTADDAQRALAAMFSGSSASTSLAKIADDLDEGGVRELFPFATLKKGNWQAYNKIPQNIFDVMPVGNRPYRMVYLGHRVGALAWAGSGDGTNKQPPLWSAAAPTPAVSPLAGEINRRMMKIGSKIQYTGGEARAKFDAVGRLTPEIHVFGWRPDTGFIVLVCGTFKSTELSLKAFESLEGKGGVPIVLEIGSEHQHNPKATDPKKRDWDVSFLKPTIVLDEQAQKLAGAFDALRAAEESVVALAQECLKFARGEDYTGLNQADLIAKLDQYNSLI